MRGWMDEALLVPQCIRCLMADGHLVHSNKALASVKTHQKTMALRLQSESRNIRKHTEHIYISSSQTRKYIARVLICAFHCRPRLSLTRLALNKEGASSLV